MDNLTNPDRHPLLAELFAIINLRLSEAANVAALTAEVKAFKEQITTQFQSIKEAVSKAEVASEKRFEGVNEFRATLADQQRTLIPRMEAEALMRALAEKIGKIEQEMTEHRSSKTGVKEGWGFAVGVAGFVALLIGLAMAFISRQ